MNDDALYLIVASDGLTEQWSIEGVSLLVRELVAVGHDPVSVSREVCNKAKQTGSRDNITVVAMDLQRYFKVCDGLLVQEERSDKLPI